MAGVIVRVAVAVEVLVDVTVGVRVDGGVDVFVGVSVSVGVDVFVEVGVRVGPNNCPGPQAENNKLEKRNKGTKILSFDFIYTRAIKGAPGGDRSASQNLLMIRSPTSMVGGILPTKFYSRR